MVSNEGHELRDTAGKKVEVETWRVQRRELEEPRRFAISSTESFPGQGLSSARWPRSSARRTY